MDNSEQTPNTSVAPTPNSSTSSDSSEQPVKKSNTGVWIVGIIIVVVIGLGAYMLFVRNKTMVPSSTITQNVPNTPVATATTSVSPTPVISPITSANADQTLQSTDTTMQQTINQANSDLNDINSINTSQDSTSGL